MLLYTEMKALLKKERSNIRYFTKDFYNQFISEYRKEVSKAILGDESESYIETKKSDFYVKNGGAYCTFLQMFFNKPNLRRFRVTYICDPLRNGKRWHYIYAEDMDIAVAIAKADLKEPFKYYQVLSA